MEGNMPVWQADLDELQRKNSPLYEQIRLSALSHEEARKSFGEEKKALWHVIFVLAALVVSLFIGVMFPPEADHMLSESEYEGGRAWHHVLRRICCITAAAR